MTHMDDQWMWIEDGWMWRESGPPLLLGLVVSVSASLVLWMSVLGAAWLVLH